MMKAESEHELRSEQRPFSRRSFVWSLSAIAAGSVSAPILLAGCRGERPPLEPDEEPPRTAIGEQPGPVTSECAGFDDVDDQTVHLRQVLRYQDDSPDENEYCGICRFFAAPEGDAHCGNCSVLRSPVHAEGHCHAWSSRDV